MPIPRRARFFARALVCASVALFPAAAHGQTVDVKVTDARATRLSSGDWRISVLLSKGIDVVGFDDAQFNAITGGARIKDPVANPIIDPANYAVVDLETIQRLAVDSVRYSTSLAYTLPVGARARPKTVLLYLPAAARLDTLHAYQVRVSNLKYEGGKGAGKTVAGPLTWRAGDAPERELEAADGRDDADFYAAVDVSGTRLDAAVGGVDVKIDREWATPGLGRSIWTGVVVDFRASSDPDADPDALALGASLSFAPWQVGDPTVRSLVQAVWSRNVLKLEGTRDLDHVNTVLENRLTLQSPTWDLKNGAVLYARPFFGNEAGYTLASPADEASGRFIERLMAGGSITFRQALESEGLEKFSVQAAVVRRWPLRDEVHFQDDDGDASALRLGKAPRTHLLASLGLDVTTHFGVAVKYEWGELPPAYKLVDGKLSFGFTYKASLGGL